METTKNKLSSYEKNFFDKLRNYIDKPIYFYGSIQRDDYFSQKSDIDIDIFSDNEISTLHMVQNFLNLGKNEFKKSVYKMDKTNKVIPGYKGKYIDLKHNLNVEISVYNDKYKDDILEEHLSKFNLPFYIIFILIILKILHYNLGILPIVYYSKFKKLLTNYCYDNNTAAFVIIDI
jgi:predicted nucleotidyltransferase